jgi:hypothetical protein
MAWSGWSLDGSWQLDKGDHITWIIGYMLLRDLLVNAQI